MREEKAPSHPDSGYMGYGFEKWIVNDAAWENATHAVQLAAIDVVGQGM